MGFEKLYVGVILGSLFFFSLTSFGIGLGNDNNADVSLLDNQNFNNTFYKMQGNLSTLQDTAQRQRSIFEDEDVQATAGDLIFFGIISTAKTFSSNIVSIFSIIIIPLLVLLKISSVVLGSLAAIMLGKIIFKSWRLHKTGE